MNTTQKLILAITIISFVIAVILAINGLYKKDE